MKSAAFVLAALSVLPLGLLSAPLAWADLPCYMAYPGNYTLDLNGLCGGEPSFEDADIVQLRSTHPVLETTAMIGDIVQGRTLVGTFYNPNARISDRVTLFYSVQTTQEMKTGTLMAPAIAPNSRTQIEVVFPDLRGIVEAYQFEILD